VSCLLLSLPVPHLRLQAAYSWPICCTAARHVHVLLRISAVNASSGSMRDESPAFETLRRRSQTRGGRWLGKGGETRGAGETLELTPRSPCREIDSRRLRETARAESEQPCGRFTELRAGCTYGRESLDFA